MYFVRKKMCTADTLLKDFFWYIDYRLLGKNSPFIPYGETKPFFKFAHASCELIMSIIFSID